MKFKAIDNHSNTDFTVIVGALMAEGWVLVRSGMESRAPNYPVHWAHLIMYEQEDMIGQ